MVGRMKRISAALAAAVTCGLLVSGCGSSNAGSSAPSAVDVVAAAETSNPRPGQKVGKVLPFSVCNLSNDPSKAFADIKVVGGHSNDWVATGLAVAQQLRVLGVGPAVSVYIIRSDLEDLDTAKTQPRHKWLAHVVYDDGRPQSEGTTMGTKPWSIRYATDNSVATRRALIVEHDFEALLKKHGNPWNDEKLVAIIKKKHGIKGDWPLLLGNLVKYTEDPSEYFIDVADQADKLRGLKNLKAHPGRNIECPA